MKITKLLEKRVLETQSFLCVGLDPEQDTLTKLGMENHLTELNIAIIDATAEFACAFKPQFAHYGALQEEGALQNSCRYIKQRYPHIPVLLDAKRGDIGTTADKYAHEAFVRYGVDGVTVNPYMGMDTINPFLSYSDKATIVLIKTSNPSSVDLQDLTLQNGEKLFIYLATKLASNPSASNLWFVVGGTHTDAVKRLRELCPSTTFLVPGVGSQGGDVETVIKYGMGKDGMGLVINVSRGITSPDQQFTNLAEYIELVSNRACHFHGLIKSARLKHMDV